jgi:hypothetical protein
LGSSFISNNLVVNVCLNKFKSLDFTGHTNITLMIAAGVPLRSDQGASNHMVIASAIATAKKQKGKHP